MRTTRLFVAG